MQFRKYVLIIVREFEPEKRQEKCSNKHFWNAIHDDDQIGHLTHNDHILYIYVYISFQTLT